MSWELLWHWYNRLFGSLGAFEWKVILPICLFGLHGYGATWMAVKMLFHPYEAKFFWFTKIPIPMTPGIFPKRRAKLAQAIASMVTDTLLTPSDIKAKVESLLVEQNIYLAIDLFIESVLLEFRDTTKLHRLASDIAELSPTMLNHLVGSIIHSVETGKDHRVATICEKIFDHAIVTMRISLDQANEIANRLMEAFVTPVKVRSALITLLSPQNISALDESIQAHAGGPYRILARIIGIKRVCYEWRNFLEKEPDEAHKLINDLVHRFGIRDQIAMQIANFDVRSLPLQSVAKLRENLVTFVESFLVKHKDDIMQTLGKLENEARTTVRTAIIHFNPENVPAVWIDRAKQDLANFAYSYLKRELGVLLEKAIPALGMYSLIARKVDLFSPRQIEDLIHKICKQELRALEYFGFLIGLFLGLMQVIVNAIEPGP